MKNRKFLHRMMLMEAMLLDVLPIKTATDTGAQSANAETKTVSYSGKARYVK